MKVRNDLDVRRNAACGIYLSVAAIETLMVMSDKYQTRHSSRNDCVSNQTTYSGGQAAQFQHSTAFIFDELGIHRDCVTDCAPDTL